MTARAYAEEIPEKVGLSERVEPQIILEYKALSTEPEMLNKELLLTITELAPGIIIQLDQTGTILFVQHQLANKELRDVEVYSGPIRFNESTMLR